ncbi:hypothetical protein RJT34_17334 [Clitoria ternatea]|uniref:Germin-like protein n=1 Tax=Clitoria ternatea TaxID=43366 RepID=A0AAN9J8S9_CLITE
MKMIYLLSLFTILLVSTSYVAVINDFCVADLKGPVTPKGYNCKWPVAAKDFVFHGFAANISNSVNGGFLPAFVTNFRALNGLGISAARLDFSQGESYPTHTHPSATELLILVEGEMTAGFITNKGLYVKPLKQGDLMVFP